MDKEPSPYSVDFCGNSHATSSLENRSTDSSLSNEDSIPEIIPSTDNTNSNFQFLTNELVECNSTSCTAAVDSLQLSPHNVSNHVSSTVSPLQYPILDMDPTPLPFSSTSANDFQNFDDPITMAPPDSNPNFPSSSEKRKVRTVFHCPICNKNIVCYARIMKEVNKHLDTHLNVLCPICNCSICGVRQFQNHIHLCGHINKAGKICPICKKSTPRKITKHMLSHVSTFKCPVPDCSTHISIVTKSTHISTHIHPTDSNFIELVPTSEKTFPKSPRSRGRRPRTNKSRHSDPYPRKNFSNEPNYLRNPVLYPTQQCNIQIDLSNIQKGDSIRTIGPELPPFDNLARPNAPENYALVKEKADVGGWEKHTKGIGSKLMNMMGYIPGQGLGPRGEGILKPLEAVVLPKRANLDRIMCMRAAGALSDISKRGNVANARVQEEKDLDRRITKMSDYLEELTSTILMHENYLGLLQKLINETDKKFENLDEIIEISDDEERTSSEDLFIGPQWNVDAISDCLVISSDDDI